MSDCLEVKQLYAVLQNDHWISRKDRIEWYLNNYYSSFLINESYKGIQILGTVPQSSSIDGKDLPVCHLNSQTEVFFFSSTYRFVFGLDLSASVLRIDSIQPCAVLESLLENLKICLKSLLDDFTIPEANINFFQPDIYVSIFAQWHATSFKNIDMQGRHVQHKFIVHCCLLKESCIESLINSVKEFIYNIKNTFTNSIISPLSCKQQDILVELLKTGISNFKHSKSNSNLNVVIISDGVVGVPELLALDKLLKEYHRHEVSCFFVHVVAANCYLCDFGCIPNVDLMIYIASATNGCYIERCHQDEMFKHRKSLKRRLLIKPFVFCRLHAAPDLPISPTLLYRKQDERSLNLPFLTLLRCRMLEGYWLKKISIEDQFLVAVLKRLWWGNFTSIEYKVTTSWPLEKSATSCKIEVFVIGTYEFLHDVYKGFQNTWTTTRKLVFKSFLQFTKDLVKSEHMLYYLLTSMNNPDQYIVSEPLQQGQALFYITPVKDNAVAAGLTKQVNHHFLSFWKVVLNLDLSSIHQWFHVHSVEVILQPDISTMTGYYTAKPQYSRVSCDMGYNALIAMLRSYSDFILSYNSIYIKFIYDSKDVKDQNSLEQPISFIVLRLVECHPLTVIKVAFLLGLSVEKRAEILSDLRKNIENMSSTSHSVTTIKRVRHPSCKSNKNTVTDKNSTDLDCLGVLLQRPINEVLVRYLCSPNNLLTLNYLNDSERKLLDLLNTDNARLSDKSCFYMHHKRCVWSIKDLDYAKTLVELLVRIRHAEGYHIAFSSAGIQNMVCELSNIHQNKNEFESGDNCICKYGSHHIQYIVFPPEVKDIDSSYCAKDSDDDDSDVKFSKKPIENLLAVEICVDPQETVIHEKNMKYPTESCCCKNIKTQHYRSLNMRQMADNIFAYDTICLSSVQTLETLNSMCAEEEKVFTLPASCKLPVFNQGLKSNVVAVPEISISMYSDDRIIEDQDEVDNLSNIVHYPTVFNFEALLRNCSRVKLLLSLLEQTASSKSEPNELIFEHFHSQIFKEMDSEIKLSEHESENITDIIFSKVCFSCEAKQKRSPHSSLDISWKCYLKSICDMQMFILFIPSTYQDHLTFNEEFTSCSHRDTDTTVTDPLKQNSPKENESMLEAWHGLRFKRRISTKKLSTSSNISSKSNDSKEEMFLNKQRTLSVFLFECSLKKFVRVFLQSDCAFVKQNVEWYETVEDYRVSSSNVLDGNFESSLIQSTGCFDDDNDFSGLYDGDLDNEDVFSSQNKDSLVHKNFCYYIRDLYYRSFVSIVFTAVKSSGAISVSNDDVHIATDYFMDEYVDEVDITNFLLFNCPETLYFKASQLQQKSLSQSMKVEDSSIDSHFTVQEEETLLLEKDSFDASDQRINSSQQSTFKMIQPHFVKSKQICKSLESNRDNTEINIHSQSAFVSFDKALEADKTELETSTECDKTSVENKEEDTPEKPIPKKIPAQSLPNTEKLNTLIQQCLFVNDWKNLPDFSVSKIRSRNPSSASESCVSKYFDNVLHLYCSPVPSISNLFYAATNHTTALRENDSMLISNLDSDPECDFGTNEDSVHNLELFSSVQAHTHSSKQNIAANSDYESTKNGAYNDAIPLFLSIFCTVRDRKSGNHGIVPVSTMPTNLRTVLNSFERHCDKIDLSALQITLDFIWIYLPDPSDNNSPPATCLSHIDKTRKTVEWLVRDEYISALSKCDPLSEDSLGRITEHVRSVKSNNCHVVKVPLTFIYGADKSRLLFAKEFDKLRVPDYKLRKEKTSYYWKFDCSFFPINPLSSVNSSEDLSTVDRLIKFSNQSKSSQNLSFKTLNVNSLSVPEIEADILNEASNSDFKSSRTNKSSSTSNIQLPILLKGKSKMINENQEDHFRFCSSPWNPDSNHTSNQSSIRKTHFTKPKDTSVSVPVTPTDLQVANISQNMFNFEPNLATRKFPSNFMLGQVVSNDALLSPLSADSSRQLSCTSWMESGYDAGGESDFDDCPYSVSCCKYWNPDMTRFKDLLAIMRVKDDECILYLHTRASSNNSKGFGLESKRVFPLIKSNIRRARRSVNQILLLKELNETRICHPLLVEESPEEVWARHKKDIKVQSSSIADSGDCFEDKISLAASLLFLPGHFACSCRLKHVIDLHHKLTDAHHNTNVSVAMTTVRAHLKSFSVENQKDMFVFVIEDQSVCYCKILVNFRLHDGRRSSVLFAENEDTEVEALPTAPKPVNKCQMLIYWYGVHELNEANLNYIEGLRLSIQRKMEDVVLEYLMLMLSRNPMFKISPADINLIQPRKSDIYGKFAKLNPPNDKVAFSLPVNLVSSSLYSDFVFYLHQNMFQFLIAPRYTDSSSKNGQFLSYSELRKSNSDDITLASKIYLYIAFTEKGKADQGIACISSDVLLNHKHCETSASRNLNFLDDVGLLIKSTFAKKIDVSELEDNKSKSDICYPIARFCIWRQDNMQTESLIYKLEQALHHSMCDLINEKFLCMPLKDFTMSSSKTLAMRNLVSELEDPSLKCTATKVFLEKNEITESYLSAYYHTYFPNWLLHAYDRLRSPSVAINSMQCTNLSIIPSIVGCIREELEKFVPDANVLCYQSIDGKIWSNFSSSTSQSNDYIVIALGRHNKFSQGLHSTRITSFQKFAPHDPSIQRDCSPSPHDLQVKEYISRRNAIIVKFSLTKISLLMYNLANDKSKKLIQSLKHQIHFKETRYRLLQNLTFQKLGLFKANLPMSKLLDLNNQPYGLRSLIDDKPKIRENPKLRNSVDEVFFGEQLPSTVESMVITKEMDQLKVVGEQALSVCRKRRHLVDDSWTINRFACSGSCCVSPSFTYPRKSFAVVFSYARLIYTVTCPVLTSKTLEPIAKSSSDHSTRPSRFLSKKYSGGEKIGKVDENQQARCNFHLDALLFMKKGLFETYNKVWKDFKLINLVSSSNKDNDEASNSSDHEPVYFYRVVSDSILILTIDLKESKCVAKLYVIENVKTTDSRTLRHNIDFILCCCGLAKSTRFQSLCFDLHINFLCYQLQHKIPTDLLGNNFINLISLSVEYYSRFVDTTERLQCTEVIHTQRKSRIKSSVIFDFLIEHANRFGFKSIPGRETSEAILLSLKPLDEKVHLKDCPYSIHSKYDIQIIVSKSKKDDIDDKLSLLIYVIFTESKNNLSNANEEGISSLQLMKQIQSEINVSHAFAAGLEFSEIRRNSLDDSDELDCQSGKGFIRNCEMYRTRCTISKLLVGLEIECQRSILYTCMYNLAKERSNLQNTQVKNDLKIILEISRVSSASDYEPDIDSLLSEIKFDRDRFLKRFIKFSYCYVINENLSKRVCVFPQSKQQFIDVMIVIGVNVANVITSVKVVLPLCESVVCDVKECDSTSKNLLEQILNEFFNLALLQRLI